MPTKPLKLANATLPTDLDCLSAVVLAALPKPSDEQRDGLSAGAHPVDLDVRLRIVGELVIGAAGSATQINKLKPWTLAKLLANHVPAAVLSACIDQALAAAQGPEAATEVMEAEADDLKARVEAVFAQAGLVVTQPRRGAVKLKGDIDIRVTDRTA